MGFVFGVLFLAGVAILFGAIDLPEEIASDLIVFSISAAIVGCYLLIILRRQRRPPRD